jgi:hypothetical protein
MVGTLRSFAGFASFVSAALKWCWSVLLRVVEPAVGAVAVNPAGVAELPLGASCRFRLASVVVSVNTGTPVEVSDDVRQMLEQRRSAFARGELFRPLEQIGASGAVMIAHITERGFTNAEHFLAVYPSPANRPLDRPLDRREPFAH